MEKIKVYHIIERISDQYGGPAVSLPSMIKSMDLQLIDNYILSVDTSGSDANTLVKKYGLACFLYKRTLFFKYFSLPLIFSLISILRRDENCVFHFHSIWSSPAWFGILLCRAFKKPYVISPRSSLMERSLKKKALIKKILLSVFLKKFLRGAEFIHATDLNESEDLRSIGYEGDIFLLSHGVETNNEKNPILSNKYDSFFSSKKNHILYMARIHPRKGLDILIESLLDNPELLSLYDVIIAGDIEDVGYYEDLRAKIDSSIHSGCFHFLGHVSGDDKISIFLKSDVFVLTSKFENFGMSIAEALSSGLPVIIGDCNPWGEVVENNVGTVATTPFEVATFLRYFSNLNEADKGELSNRCKKFASQKGSWDLVAEKFISKYRELIYDIAS